MEADKLVLSSGEFFFPKVAELPIVTSPDDEEGRVLFRTTDKKIFIHDGINFIDASRVDIPDDSEVLFRSDIAMVGYSLVTESLIDDGLVYITKGSGAGGETGGTLKSGSTWSQPGHTHTGPSHTHSIGTHTHTFSGTSTTSANDLASNFGVPDEYGKYVAAASHTHVVSGTTGGGTGTTGADGTGTTGAGGTGNTGSSTTVNTWRPKGHNFTVQKRV
jgi:hypothetical protein